MLNRLLLAACLGLGILGGASSLRAQTDPASLPAHDTHQGVTVAVRPLMTEAAYKTQFGSGHTPYEAGILALEVFFRNDNDKPIRLKLDTMRLLVNLAGQSPQSIDGTVGDWPHAAATNNTTINKERIAMHMIPPG